MIIKKIYIKHFRAIKDQSFSLGKRLTVIAGRNATQKTTILGMLSQPFTLTDRNNQMKNEKTIDGKSFKSQFSEKFKMSERHDPIGSHEWTLYLNEHIYGNGEFTVKSISRKQNGKETLRFWNASSKAAGSGYIQIPTYYLSLSRLFPIGETRQNKPFDNNLTDEEMKDCISIYRRILSVQSYYYMNSEVCMRTSNKSGVLTGIDNNIYDILANSAGESNVMKIILSVFVFRRLKEKYPQDYKGGLLLIDELDATLFPFAQRELVKYLYDAANKYKIQIVFTSHSETVLKAVFSYLREEKKKNSDLPDYAYNTSIVYLEPYSSDENERLIKCQNVVTARELKEKFQDINLLKSDSCQKLRLYCEDEVAQSFVKYMCDKYLKVNVQNYFDFVSVDLGWANYMQLLDKNVPEFLNSVIVLDHDVSVLPEYTKRTQLNGKYSNQIFLPLTVEKDMFAFFKQPKYFNKLLNEYILENDDKSYSQDICFAKWPEEKYKTSDLKEWYKSTVKDLGGYLLLYKVWCDNNLDRVYAFLDDLVNAYNRLCESNDLDYIQDDYFK